MIKVSVCVMTYNQKEYIGQCLESLVTQKTDFELEIIVGDDFSTDGTRDIIREYQKEYPEIIKPIFRDSNVGITENIKEIYFAASGEYIAHMDGDDYALPGKLQIQADFLDNNPECSGVFHLLDILHPNGVIEKNKYLTFKDNNKFNLSDSLCGVAIGGNSSKMFRASVLHNICVPNIELLDYYFHVITAEKGYLSFVLSTESYGVYRKGSGVTVTSKRKIYNSYKDIFLYFIGKYPKEKQWICIAVFQMMLSAIKSRHYTCSIGFLRVLLRVRCLPFIKWFKIRAEK
jgi:glycosyltransferase involved in cell wall biosynthesis